ncbi:MAG: MSMEG_0565 family glycosyltransferase [Actinomycetota bacterium]|nr:MSMEG_0565 family glycosyltransferase [Actinomycetota bacterium]
MRSAIPRVALVTYSTKPRGGVVHTLALAEAMVGLGVEPTVVALGDLAIEDGFYRPVRVPYALIQSPDPAPTLEERVFAAVDALAEGLAELVGEFDVLHTQDYISGRAAMKVRQAGGDVFVLRTVHHVDDFTTPALIDCQRRAILEPDRLLVVSEHWRQLLHHEYGVAATVVPNGVDPARFAPISEEERAAFRARAGAGAGATGRFMFLTVGGIEPRKGSVYLLEALGLLKARLDLSPVLVVVGGHSFQDYAAYREAALGRLPEWGLRLGDDIVMVGTVDDTELAGWYRAADALAFPSLKEGFGLVILEALSAGLPVVATDMPVFREYLTDRRDSLLVPVEDARRLAGAMEEVMVDQPLRARLRRRGSEVVGRFTWTESARQHLAIYEEIIAAKC